MRRQGFCIMNIETGSVKEDDVSMYMPKLHVQSNMGRIGIESRRAFLELTQPRAELSIEQRAAQINIETNNGVLHIDQTEAFAEAGLKSVKRSIQEHAQDGYQAYLEGIGRRASQGSELMHIEDGSNAIVQQAEANAYESLKELGITFIPGPFSVQIQYEKGSVDIQVTTKSPRIKAHTRPVETNYVQGNISIYMSEYPSLEIAVDPQFFERI